MEQAGQVQVEQVQAEARTRREPAGEPVAVLGDLNLETSVRIDRFPVHVGDTMFTLDGIADGIGGAATNVACGLAALGHEVRLGAVIGADRIGDLVLEQVRGRGLETRHVRRDWPATARTVVLVDGEGDRRCLNDPKLANEYRYPDEALAEVMDTGRWVFVSTQSWCRHAARAAVESGRRVAVDVQAIRGIDEYHRDFLDLASLVILSTERLEEHSHQLMHRLWAEHDVEVVVATHGADGATLGVRATGTIVWEPAHDLRPVVDRTGAGDAFAAGLMSAVLRGRPWREALTAGQLVAAWAIGEPGSSRGHPSAARVAALLHEALGSAPGGAATGKER